MYCQRCKNTGKITEQYADFKLPMAHRNDCLERVVELVPIKMREVECPECLGFGAVGWALPA